MFERFEERSDELEHLDKGDYTPTEYEACLVELRRVNQFLGDASALRRSLLAEIERTGDECFSVLDVGAGSGELLRVIAGWAGRSGRAAQLVGLELNARSAQAILEESKDFPSISAVRGDALRLPFTDGRFDYAICSLFTHHFKDDGVVRIMRELARVASRRILIIDLHRHPLAYFLYTTVGRIFLHNRLIREDGALSILRSFRPAELGLLAHRAGLGNISVKRRFPFRLVLSADAQGQPSAGEGAVVESSARRAAEGVEETLAG
ncbi:MAG TPA: methyltransferase domain-containing protein [Pyrinomonadaceae bacterium]|jgi:SAM-dependent methyltransferase|nr:methyltransferase domain-containing protein [Pyrinomonadaceae bacterium]